MTPRRLGLLLAASLAALVLAVWVVNRQPGAGTSAAGKAVLPGLENALNSVTEVRITGAGGVHTIIDKGARHWLVRERGYPADSGKLRQLLIELGDLKIVERKTRLARNYPILGVQNVTSAKADGKRIDVITPHKTWSLIVGDSANDNDCYVRVVDHKQSLLASPLVMVAAKPARWVDPVILDLGQKRIRSIAERPARGWRFSIARAKASQGNFTVQGVPPGRKLDSAGAADEMASALSDLTLEDVRKAGPPPKGALLSHALFATFDGLEVDVTGYQAGKGGKHYIDVLAHGSGKKAAAQAARIDARVRGWQYQIPGYRYRQIFQPLSGLLAPLPHPKH